MDAPLVTERSDGTISVDYSPGGPFLVLSRKQAASLVVALYRKRIIDPRDKRWPWAKAQLTLSRSTASAPTTGSGHRRR